MGDSLPEVIRASAPVTLPEGATGVTESNLYSALLYEEWLSAINISQSLSMAKLLYELDTDIGINLNNVRTSLQQLANQPGLERLIYAVDLIVERRLPTQSSSIGSFISLVSESDKNSAAQFLAQKLVSVARHKNPNPLEHLVLLLLACSREDISNLSHIVYLLATAHHESNMGAALVEPANSSNTNNFGQPGAQLFSKYENNRNLGNTQTGDGERFRGRGYVHLTGRDNYNRISQSLEINPSLVDQPEEAAQLETAAHIIAYGMRVGFFRSDDNGQPNSLVRYGNDENYDYFEAREIVNGDKNKSVSRTTVGKLIEDHALNYRRAILSRSGYGTSR